MKTDPAIDEIRKVRHEISVEFEHDAARMVAYYLERQQQREARRGSESKDAASAQEA